MEQGNIIKTGKGKATMLKNGIILVETDDNLVLEVEDAKEFTSAVEKLAKGNKCLLITNPGKNTTAGPEVRKYAASEEANRHIRARAIITQSFAQELMANFFLRFNAQIIPTKLFHHREKAIKWLLGLSDKKPQVSLQKSKK